MPVTRSTRRQVAASSQPVASTSSSSSRATVQAAQQQQARQQQPARQTASQPLPNAQAYTVVVPGPDDSDFLDSETDGDHLEDWTQNDAPSTVTRYQDLSAATGEVRPVRPLVQIAPRIYFAVFPHPAPDMAQLSAGDGSRCVILPPADAQELEEQQQQQSRRRANNAFGDSGSKLHKPKLKHWEWLTIDQDLPYLSFFDDWGPLNIGMFWRFCTHVHEWRIDPDTSHKNLVVYTSTDPHRKANAALLMSLWALVIEKVEPADAFFPFSTWEFEPFRDAGYGRADFNLSIQDVIYGLHRGLQTGLLDLSKFDINEYEYYEQVQNGDWNWITPNFIAFASPNDKEYVAELRANALAQEQQGAGFSVAPRTHKLKRPMSKLMTDTIRYFRKNNVKLVVRLNNPLYDKKVFEDAGIRHVDMYFDDGSNPSTEILRNFIKMSDEVVKAGGVIAVHCKAGLGRTGVLIGAYLIWNHGFTANEVIGFMRLMRPGCVVGPQQHFMYTNFVEWVRWGERARLEEENVGKAKWEEEKLRIERELERSRAEVKEVQRKLAAAHGASKGGLEQAKSEEAARMRFKRKSSADEDDEAEIQQQIVSESDAGPVTPKQRKVSHFSAAAASTSEDAATPVARSSEFEHVQLRPTTIVKPPPVVGQPRKSPSPSRKRIAQLQAGPGENRLGSKKSGSGSSDSDRSTDSFAMPLSQNLHAGNVQIDQQDVIIAARPLVDEDGGLKQTSKVAVSSTYVRTGSTATVSSIRVPSTATSSNHVASTHSLAKVVEPSNSTSAATSRITTKTATTTTRTTTGAAYVRTGGMTTSSARAVPSSTVAGRTYARVPSNSSKGAPKATSAPSAPTTYVRTGGMATPSGRAMATTAPAPGSTTPQHPPPLPVPVPAHQKDGRPAAGVLARLNRIAPIPPHRTTSASAAASVMKTATAPTAPSASGPVSKRPRIVATAAESKAPIMTAASVVAPENLPTSIEGRLMLAMGLPSSQPNPSPAKKGNGGPSMLPSGSGSGSAAPTRTLQRNMRPRRSSLGEADLDVQA
ncbi:cell division control protein 14 [Tilletia horrida]|nr:cell division control protein 14 [Tilletia horrida]